FLTVVFLLCASPSYTSSSTSTSFKYHEMIAATIRKAPRRATKGIDFFSLSLAVTSFSQQAGCRR
ncbi:hypothetical protein PFISCL1PPCAC_15361, partial [Pristionchus fissidentatus]